MAKKTTTTKTRTTKVDNKKIKEVEKIIENTDVTLDMKEEDVDLEETNTAIETLANTINEIEESQKGFNEKIEKNPENAEKIIDEEIKKAQNIKTKIDKITADQKEEYRHYGSFTDTWNGMHLNW